MSDPELEEIKKRKVKELMEKAKAKVIVYSTPTCPFCDLVKRYLKEHNIEYIDYNVAADHEKAKEMYMKSGQLGVPVLDINGTIIVGFNKQAIAKALGIDE
jgi:glutaredoxin-like YruB-family protein